MGAVAMVRATLCLTSYRSFTVSLSHCRGMGYNCAKEDRA
jgi:hypothetical protein